MNPTKKPDPKSGLPEPRPDGQPAQGEVRLQLRAVS